MAQDHDHSYKLLFSHPRMVRDLLAGFVREDWIAQLDFESLERVSASYVSDDLRTRASDIVWRLRWRDEDACVYVLLEFQSTVEPGMALRTLAYVALLYQDAIRANLLPRDRRLPPVLPIVLYNGLKRWDAAGDTKSLIARAPRALRRYTPQMRYMLIDEGRLESASLLAPDNLAAAAFRLENSRTRGEMHDVIGALARSLSTPESASLRLAFVEWIRRVILRRFPGVAIEHINDLQELRTMLAERMDQWEREFELRGLQKGLRKGHQQGESQLLLRQLRKRFGELPEAVRERIEHARPEQLECWGERLLDVASLNDVFEGEALPAI